MAKPVKGLPGLAAYLKQADLTQKEFGDRVGASQSVISDIIKGEHAPSFGLLLKISKQTGLTLDELVSAKAA